MEVQIDTLVEKIKQHGISQGEMQAAEILKEAKKEAEAIVSTAKKESESIIADAKAQSEVLIKRGKDALVQAHRDLLLSVREDIKKLLQTFVSQESHKALTAESLQDLLVKVLPQWSFTSGESIFISLSESDAKTLVADTIQGLLQSHNNAITLRADASVGGGFRISRSGDGALQFDFTDKTLSESLISFLTPKLQELLQE